MILFETERDMRYKSKYFKRNYVLSLFIYIIPIILLLVLIINTLTVFIRNTIKTNVQSELESALATADENIGILDKIAFNLSEETVLQSAPGDAEKYRCIEIQRALGRQMYFTSFCSNIIYYFRGADKIYTQGVVDEKNAYFNYAFDLEKGEMPAIDKLLNNSLVSELVPAKIRAGRKSEETILYVVPILNRREEATVVFVIQKQWFAERFGSFCSEYDGAVSVSLADGKPAVTLGNMNAYSGTGLFFRKNFEMLTGKNSSGNMGITAVLKKSRMFGPLYRIYAVIIAYIAALLILGFFLITWITRRAYIPIMNLKYMIENEVNSDADDLEVIRSGIESIKMRNNKLEDILKKREQKLKSLIISDILSFKKNNYDTESVLYDETDRDGFSLCQRIVFVVSDAPGEMIADIFEAEESITAYELESEYVDTSIFLIRYGENTLPGLKNIFERVVQEFRLKTGMPARIIAGRNVDSVYDVKESFLSVYNSYTPKTTEGVVMLDESEYKDKYPVELLAGFERAMQNYNVEGAGESLEAIKAYATDFSLNTFLKKCVIFEVYNIFIKRIYNDDGAENKLNFIQKMLEDKENLDMQNIGKVFDEFSEYMKMILHYKENGSNSRLVSDCCGYINNNFFDYNLSVQSLADRFGVSSSFLNNQMKAEIRMNVYEYITFIKMEQAKYMLEKTNLPVKSVVEYVGYFDVSSFGRKFKGIYGVSPSDYRKSKRKEN